MVKLIILACLLISSCYSVKISPQNYLQEEFNNLIQSEAACQCTVKSAFAAWGAFCTGQCNSQSGCAAYAVYCDWTAASSNTTNTTTGCLNNCSAHGTCNTATGVCTCSSNWSGTDCSTYVYTCPSNCSAHGTCNTNNGICSCWAGYAGTDCSITALSCPNNCSNAGTCNTSTGVCSCNNYYSGSDCSILNIPCPNDCSSHGTCNSQTGICTCTSPYAGSDCSSTVSNSSNTTCGCQVISGYEPWASSCNLGCNSSSICAQYSVYCQWSSANTIQCPNNCSNQGTCNNVNGVCTCNAGFSGSDCSQIPCTNDCSGHGTCDTTKGVCTCSSGWQSSDCSVQVLSCPSNCSNKGTCNTLTGVCTCNLGYTGSSCSTVQVLQCPNSCSSHGTCNTTTGVCTCASGYGGTDCSTVIYSCPNACSGNGVCNTNTGACSCNTYYSGVSCSTFAMPCPNSCTSASQGTCNDQTGTCTCASGYTGTDCSVSSQTVQTNVTYGQTVYALTWQALTTNDIFALFKPACLGLAQQINLAYAVPDQTLGISFVGQSPNQTVFYQNVNQSSINVYKYAIQNLYSTYGVQTLISIGGFSLTNTFNFLTSTLTTAQVQAWAQNVKNQVDAYGARGIDIDFESTNQTLWQQVFVKNNIIGALRKAMPTPYEIQITMPYGAAIKMTSDQIAAQFNPTVASGWGAQAATDVISLNWNDIDSINLMTFGSDSNLDPAQAINLARQSINSYVGINNAQLKLNMGGLIGTLSTCATSWCSWTASSATTAATYVKNNNYQGIFWWPEGGNINTQIPYYQAAYTVLTGKSAATALNLPGVC